MPRFFVLVALLLPAFSVVFGQDKPQYLCNGSLSVHVPDVLPLEFQSVVFESGLGGSGGSVSFLNKSDKGVQYYLVVMEFLDGKENYLVSAPVYNVAEKDSNSVRCTIQALAGEERARRTHGANSCQVVCP